MSGATGPSRPITYDWVHPSWRDLVIDHLMRGPQPREMFLARCGMAGLLLALSNAGGQSGERVQPLLRTPQDWQTLRRRALDVIADETHENHLRLLLTLRDLLEDEQGPAWPEASRLAGEVLPAIVAACDARAQPLPVMLLAIIYEVSEHLTPLPHGPRLEATWAKHNPVISTAVTDETVLDDACKFRYHVARNEPRLLRRAGWPDTHETFITSIVTNAEQQLHRSVNTLKRALEGTLDGPGLAQDATMELFTWRRALQYIVDAGAQAPAGLLTQVVSTEQGLDQWLEDYEEERAQEREFDPEDDLDEDEPTAETWDEQVKAIFSDL